MGRNEPLDLFVGLRGGCMVRTTLRGAIALLLAAALGWTPAARAQSLDPVRAQAALWLGEIYDVARWTLRVPWKLAYPYLVRLKLDPWLDGLPLEPDVRARVRANVHSREFVGEVLPFLAAVQETYGAPEDAKEQSFDAELRRRFSPRDRVPGIEHTMFAWEPKAEDAAPAALDAEVAAELVSIYDALYLRDRPPDAPLRERLECESEPDDARLRVLVARVEPSVRRLLEAAASRLDPKGEYEPALRAVLREPDRLEAVSVSLIDFVNQQVCKHYRTFATRVFREQQLREWMERELDEPGGGELWAFLAWSNDERRYAVHVIVDGLQGHLMEALASGDPRNPFVQQILAEHRNAGARAPLGERSSAAPAQSIVFLERLGGKGFQDPRYLPFFRGLYAAPSGIARVGVATTPTISVRNIPLVQTGAPVAGTRSTGIPNFHFVDRHVREQGRAYYFFGNDAVLLEALAHSAGMRTLPERLPRLSSYACAVPYDRGAHHTLDAFLNLGVGERMRDFAELRCIPDLERRATNERRLRALRAELLALRPVLTSEPPWWARWRLWERSAEDGLARRKIAEIAELEQETIPEYLAYYNPWPDHFAHFEGPFADEILAPSGELARLDYWLGRLSAVYRSAGVADRTLFGMAGDHGLTPVFHLLNPEVEVFDRMREEGVDLRVVKISSDEGEGPKLTNRLNPPSMRSVDAVVASTAGGNYMIDLFVDQGAGWSSQPVYEQVRAIRPAAGGPPVDVVHELVTRLPESLDYLAVRESACDYANCVTRLVALRDGKRADAWIDRRGDRIHYRWQGADLLDTARTTPYETLRPEDRAAHAALLKRCVTDAPLEDVTRWCNENEWRELASWTSRPDSVGQLAHLYDIDRAGTVNLFPREGIGYNTKVPGRHAGESFHEKDAFVGFWGEPITARERPRTALNGSVAVVLYEWLIGRPIVEGEDGWGFPSLTPQLFGR